MKNINDKQIKAWKEQYGGVYLLEVDAKKAYLKDIVDDIISEYLNGQGDPPSHAN